MADIQMLDLKAQYASIRADIDSAVARVIESQHFILGPEVEGLEREVASYSNAKYGIGVSSGTDAILVALMALGVGPGDEVITTPYTFVATATCIARLGARARFVDIDPATCNVNIDRIADAIGPKTKAIVPVHLYGQMCDVARLRTLTKLPIIEDGAQAIGSEYAGARAGSVGDLGCLSFFPSKNLGAFGDAGMILANDEALANTVRLLRNQGQKPKYFSMIVGGNFRLDALQAAILRAKLPHLDGWTRARQSNAALYRKLFAQSRLRVSDGDLSGDAHLALPHENDSGRHIYNQFVIRTASRDALRESLAAAGIATEIYYPQPMHLQACFSEWGHQVGDFPEAERAALQTFGLPIYPELGSASIERVVGAIESFFLKARAA